MVWAYKSFSAIPIIYQVSSFFSLFTSSMKRLSILSLSPSPTPPQTPLYIISSLCPSCPQILVHLICSCLKGCLSVPASFLSSSIPPSPFNSPLTSPPFPLQIPRYKSSACVPSRLPRPLPLAWSVYRPVPGHSLPCPASHFPPPPPHSFSPLAPSSSHTPTSWPSTSVLHPPRTFSGAECARANLKAKLWAQQTRHSPGQRCWSPHHCLIFQ